MNLYNTKIPRLRKVQNIFAPTTKWDEVPLVTQITMEGNL
jgi:hypothetical protein